MRRSLPPPRRPRFLWNPERRSHQSISSWRPRRTRGGRRPVDGMERHPTVTTVPKPPPTPRPHLQSRGREEDGKDVGPVCRPTGDLSIPVYLQNFSGTLVCRLSIRLSTTARRSTPSLPLLPSVVPGPFSRLKTRKDRERLRSRW